MAVTTKIEYHTIPDWDQPRNGRFKIILDAWWCVDEDGNPLFYSRFHQPQCQHNKSIAERLAKGRPLRQIPVVYVPYVY